VRAETRHQLKQDAFSRVTIVLPRTRSWSVRASEYAHGAIVVTAVIVAVVGGGWYYLSRQDERPASNWRRRWNSRHALRPAGRPRSRTFPPSLRRRSAPTQPGNSSGDRRQVSHTRTADMARYFLGVTAASAGDNAAAENALRLWLRLATKNCIVAKLAWPRCMAIPTAPKSVPSTGPHQPSTNS